MTMSGVERQDRGEIAILSIACPPVNALGHAIRKELVEQAESAAGDCRIKIIVIIGKGRGFSAGADIREFSGTALEPLLPEVCNRIEALEKPVLAALHGYALGGGLEVAVSAHYRIAQPTASLGLPEITLGLIPGAGGTQRVPRLCGLENSFDLMISGRKASGKEAHRLGLVDRLSSGDLLDDALAYAQELLRTGAPALQTRHRTERLPRGDEQVPALEKIRSRLKPERSHLLAPGCLLECVEAAITTPFDEALKLERNRFNACRASRQSAALRHVFFAERKASRFPEASEPQKQLPGPVAIVGGGTMGSAISAAMIHAGIDVRLIERNRERMDAAKASTEWLIEALQRRARRESGDWKTVEGALEVSDDLAASAGSKIAIEAVFEDMEVKAAILARLDAILDSDALIATNTSYLDVDVLAQAISHPDRFIGLHFFAPATLTRLVEVVVGKTTSPKAIGQALALARKLKKVPVRAGVCDGFIGNRILAASREAADLLLLDGATPYEIDQAMVDFGMKLGPFQVMDLSGLDISWSRRKRLKAFRDPGLRYCTLADRLCELGRFGRKTGRGFYLYEDSKRGQEDPEVLRLLAEVRETGHKARDQFSYGQIRRRLLVAMINEGAKLLEEGIACRPSDIDVVKVLGYGFPRWRGGPMFWADDCGIREILELLQRYAERDPAFWRPATFIRRLAVRDGRFEELNS